jgi:deoxyribose-phosphate aldolase
MEAASVCLPPCYVKEAKLYLRSYLQSDLPVCTVVGFPNGYMTKGVKFNETLEAIKDGADEIDMVINLTHVKNGHFDAVLNEIRAVRAASNGHILKVIIETCYLTEGEKIKLCEIVTEAGANFIKTSTGFGKYGATVEDVRLLREHVGANVKVKAAGGIKTIEDAVAMIEAGAERLGASSLLAQLR